MDNNTIKFGTLYTDILYELNRISENDSKKLEKAKAKYNKKPTSKNAQKLRNTMREVVLNSLS